VSTPLAISITVSGLTRLFGDDLAAVVEFARRADDLGIDQIALPDHLGIGSRTDRYPYGRFPYPAEEPWLEPVTTLAAIAGATRRIRLSTSVLIAPLRPPLLLAKTLATLDVLSRGRLDLGVGLGWQPEEFAAAGVSFRGRGQRLDDTLRACRALWSEAPASFESATVRFQGLWCLPQPVQSRGIPVWFGGRLGERNVERIVELGVGWLPLVPDLEALRAGVRRLQAAFAAAGRDPQGLGVRANARALDTESLEELRLAGASVAAFALDRFARGPDDVVPFLERLAGLRG